MRGHWKQFVLIMLALAVIAVGCVPLATPPAEDATQSVFPIGTFTGAGSWTSEYKADGSYISQSPSVSERGTYTVTGDQIVLKGDYCGNREGTYVWTFDGTALKFEPIDDECTDRRFITQQGSWLKQP